MFFFIEELAMIMDRLYGGVCYAGIDTDPELKYPKGAGRVAFLNQQSYIAAISARFVHLQMSEMDKRVNNFVNYGGGGAILSFICKVYNYCIIIAFVCLKVKLMAQVNFFISFMKQVD